MSELKNWIKKRTVGGRQILRFLTVCFLIILAITGIKGWRIYQKGMTVYEDAIALRTMARTPVGEMDFATLTSAMIHLQGDFDDFTMEVKPVLWLASRLSWVPLYGRDLAAAPDLIELVGNLVNASIITLDAGGLLFDAINSPGSGLDPAGLTGLLVDAQPLLSKARDEFDQALNVRDRIQVEQLSPRLQEIVDELDPLLGLMDDGLLLSTALPVVLGADGNGPKSYLLLVQNEDELRPTGGFITTVGKLVVQNGEIISLDFEGVDNEEDWSKPFPVAPWQLQEYMNARVLILRDSNWFADYPTNAIWAEYLYSYNHPEPLDGVIAFDQQFLVILLGVLGPLDVEGAPYPITSTNAIEYMRSAKVPPDGETVLLDWDRKEFISGLADAVLYEIINSSEKEWFGLIPALIRALNERHLLMQFDNPMITALLVEHDWDGAVRPVKGDFLMITDTNIGFNKTNALVNVNLSYDVDLTDMLRMKSSLTINHHNKAGDDIPCLQWGYKQVEGPEWYPMERCYWSYLRVYKQARTSLVDASPHAIPGEWMLHGKDIPARVDILDEKIDGVQGFGTLVVVPGSQSLSTSFDFSLPVETIMIDANDSRRYTYRLKVQKQPGMIANPLVIRIHLPNLSHVESVNFDALIQGENLLIETDLRTDVYLELTFSVQ